MAGVGIVLAHWHWHALSLEGVSCLWSYVLVDVQVDLTVIQCGERDGRGAAGDSTDAGGSACTNDKGKDSPWR